jgi:hypothetical protein
VDDDCDANVDEPSITGSGDSCSTGLIGVCGLGVQQCVAGQFECEQVEFAGIEICNFKDDDCDGSVDEASVCSSSAAPIAVSPLVPAAIGIALGTSLSGITPNSIARGGTDVWLTLSGSGLDTISSISFVPPGGITVVGPPVGAPDGLSATVIITIDPIAPVEVRQVVVEVSGGIVAAASPGANLLDITEP